MVLFAFSHLDPFGSVAEFTDAALRNLRNGGILSATCTDMASLMGRNREAFSRNYDGATTARTEFAQELSARVVLGHLARVAARHCKSITPLCVLLSPEGNCLYLTIRVNRGASKANKSLEMSSTFLRHCLICQERVFVKLQSWPNELRGKGEIDYGLTCECAKTQPGQTFAHAGPLWSDSIFDSDFLAIFQTKIEILDPDNKALLTTILRALQESQLVDCPFFFTTMQLRPRDGMIPSLEAIVKELRAQGFHAARTNLHKKGIRTSATLAQFLQAVESAKEIIFCDNK
ncbi:TRMT1-like protein [Cichlidogyrus casuarinus]|uniref:TRMT1-like protein n=1 Tax=Cichlidogyrus casuarinus TaxID=1844966 RepID=A0ABD2QLY8_9PLAT